MLGNIEQRMKTMGLLNLLCECAVYVDDDLRDSIEHALDDNIPDGWEYKKILHTFELQPIKNAQNKEAQS